MTFPFLENGKRAKAAQKAVAKKVAVKRAASGALVRYEKTFKDLAKYDRGERITLPLPR